MALNNLPAFAYLCAFPSILDLDDLTGFCFVYNDV